jgi:peptidoglycan hydrolase CwlO-like protein
MTTFIRNETKDVLENYKSYTPESLFAYLMSYEYDNDCQYIFNNLPQDLQNEIDALAGEQRKEVQKQRVEVQKQIAERDKQIAEVQQFNKQLRNKIYQQECQIELNKIFLNDLNQ